MSIGQNFINAYDIYQKEMDEVIDYFIEQGMLVNKFDKFPGDITVQGKFISYITANVVN